MTLAVYTPTFSYLLANAALESFLDVLFVDSFSILTSVFVPLFYGEMWLKRQEN